MLESEFGIKVKNETSARDSFKSISTLANYVEQKLAQEQPRLGGGRPVAGRQVGSSTTAA